MWVAVEWLLSMDGFSRSFEFAFAVELECVLTYSWVNEVIGCT